MFDGEETRLQSTASDTDWFKLEKFKGGCRAVFEKETTKVTVNRQQEFSGE